MKREEVEAYDRRVAERAHQMWEAEGKPEGREGDYAELARELLAIEEVPHATTVPVHDPRVPDAEPLIAVENQAEFPSLADQDEAPYAFAQTRLQWDEDKDGKPKPDPTGDKA